MVELIIIENEISDIPKGYYKKVWRVHVYVEVIIMLIWVQVAQQQIVTLTFMQGRNTVGIKI